MVSPFYRFSSLTITSSFIICGSAFPFNIRIFLPPRYICNCRERTTALKSLSSHTACHSRWYSPSSSKSFRRRCEHMLEVSIVIIFRDFPNYIWAVLNALFSFQAAGIVRLKIFQSPENAQTELPPEAKQDNDTDDKNTNNVKENRTSWEKTLWMKKIENVMTVQIFRHNKKHT